jgi:hypothetical protein
MRIIHTRIVGNGYTRAHVHAYTCNDEQEIFACRNAANVQLCVSLAASRFIIPLYPIKRIEL